jgi:low affinity Fe/Cu permease
MNAPSIEFMLDRKIEELIRKIVADVATPHERAELEKLSQRRSDRMVPKYVSLVMNLKARRLQRAG